MSTLLREDITGCALTLKGIGFLHQGRSPLLGLDCVGFVLAAMEGAGWAARSPETTYVNDYRRLPDGHLLRDYVKLEAYEIPRDEALPADLLVMRFGREPQHLALLMPAPRGCTGLYMMHSVERDGVVLHGYTQEWQARTLAIYRLFDFAE